MSDQPHTAGPGPAADAAPSFVLPAAAPQRLVLEFTGSGSEYFRIWIVNLLLTLVTLTLYHPFAKARKLAYFHANTLVGGHALGFHGDPYKMLRGYLLVLVFSVSYAVGTRLAPMLALVAIGAFVLVWPALWRASLQFRLGNTSWRGLRFGFDGNLAGAYRAMLPGSVPWVVMVALSVLMRSELQQPADAAAAAANGWWVTGMMSAMLAGVLLVPLSLAWIKRYQHGHYLYDGQRGRLDASTGAFYRLSFKVIGVTLLVPLAAVALAGVGGAILAVGMEDKQAAGNLFNLAMLGGVIVSYMLMFIIAMPYARSRLQNLVWGQTRSEALQFHSTLRLRPLAGLTLKNLLLTILTLGLFWPFAAVANARMRLQAVSVDVQGDLSHWAAGSQGRPGGATGDAAGDFFGFDLGL
ncbi:MAG TPA: YjgN family protein [Burkholderiaceae bacterium]|nr:YjgN family protein [Burkholderiaceae bacterium]